MIFDTFFDRAEGLFREMVETLYDPADIINKLRVKEERARDPLRNRAELSGIGNLCQQVARQSIRTLDRAPRWSTEEVKILVECQGHREKVAYIWIDQQTKT